MSNLTVPVKVLDYEIHSGSPEAHSYRLETVQGLVAACERLKEHASKFPGPYFVRCAELGTALATIDTTETPSAEIIRPICIEEGM
jgi:hypothetical protein